MNIKQLNEYLEKKDGDMIVPMGFGNAHSYRGDYECLGLEPIENVSVDYMLSEVRDAVGNIYQGWRGGDFRMGGSTEVYLAVEGKSGEKMGTVLLDYMTGVYGDEEIKTLRNVISRSTDEIAGLVAYITWANKEIQKVQDEIKELKDENIKDLKELYAIDKSELDEKDKMLEKYGREIWCLRDKVNALESELNIRNVPSMKESLKSSARLALRQDDEIAALEDEVYRLRGIICTEYVHTTDLLEGNKSKFHKIDTFKAEIIEKDKTLGIYGREIWHLWDKIYALKETIEDLNLESIEKQTIIDKITLLRVDEVEIRQSIDAELSERKHDSEVLEKVVDIVKNWDDSTGRAFPSMYKILDLLVDYTDVPEFAG